MSHLWSIWEIDFNVYRHQKNTGSNLAVYPYAIDLGRWHNATTELFNKFNRIACGFSNSLWRCLLLSTQLPIHMFYSMNKQFCFSVFLHLVHATDTEFFSLLLAFLMGLLVFQRNNQCIKELYSHSCNLSDPHKNTSQCLDAPNNSTAIWCGFGNLWTKTVLLQI